MGRDWRSGGYLSVCKLLSRMAVSEAPEGSNPGYGHEVYKYGLILKFNSMTKFVRGTGDGELVSLINFKPLNDDLIHPLLLSLQIISSMTLAMLASISRIFSTFKHCQPSSPSAPPLPPARPLFLPV